MKSLDNTLPIFQIEAIPVVVPLLHPIKWAREEIKNIDNVIAACAWIFQIHRR